MHVENINGSIVFSVDAGETTEIGNVGTVTGSSSGSTISIGNTDGETSLNFYNNSTANDDDMVVITDSDIDNISFNGSNINATIESPDNSFRDVNTITVNATNSEINSSYSNNEVYLTENSSNTEVNLGYGKNTIVDAGDYNISNSKGSTTFITTPTSDRASFNGGYHNDSTILYGSNAYVNTKGGNDTAVVGSTGTKNIVDTGAGKDTIVDNGTNSYIFSGTGADNVSMNGLNGTAKLGDDNNSISVTGRGNTVDATGVSSSNNSDIAQEWYGYSKLYDYLTTKLSQRKS